MPARTLNDFFAGFFIYGWDEAKLEAKVAITGQGGMRKGTEVHGGRRRGGAKEIQIEGDSGKEHEVIIRRGAIPKKNTSSVWSWHEEFEIAWCDTFITKGRK